MRRAAHCERVGAEVSAIISADGAQVIARVLSIAASDPRWTIDEIAETIAPWQAVAVADLARRALAYVVSRNRDHNRSEARAEAEAICRSRPGWTTSSAAALRRPAVTSVRSIRARVTRSNQRRKS